MSVRTLLESDRKALEAFLDRRAAESMFLTSNLAQCGVEDRVHRHGGEFLGAFRDQVLRGVVQLTEMGSLLLLAADREAVTGLAEAAGKLAYRPRRLMGMKLEVEDFSQLYLEAVTGLVVRRMVDAKLMRTSLDTLVPQPMNGFRAATSDDLGVLVPWQRAFLLEEGLATEGEVGDAAMGEQLAERIAAGQRYLLEVDGVPVSMASINASTPEMSQIGGVFTPPERRGQGHATRLVAAICHFHLSALGEKGVVLAAHEDNLAAMRVYQKVGFAPIGTYRYVFLE